MRRSIVDFVRYSGDRNHKFDAHPSISPLLWGRTLQRRRAHCTSSASLGTRTRRGRPNLACACICTPSGTRVGTHTQCTHAWGPRALLPRCRGRPQCVIANRSLRGRTVDARGPFPEPEPASRRSRRKSGDRPFGARAQEEPTPAPAGRVRTPALGRKPPRWSAKKREKNTAPATQIVVYFGGETADAREKCAKKTRAQHKRLSVFFLGGSPPPSVTKKTQVPQKPRTP